MSSIYFPDIPGQGWVLHDLVSEASPTQLLPPCLGGGLVQVLSLCSMPPPQVTGHLLHVPHDAQFPSTIRNELILFHDLEINKCGYFFTYDKI